MAAPFIPSFTFKKPITSTDLQALADAITYALYRPYATFSANGTAQTIPNNTPTPVAWNVNVRANKITHDTVTNNSRFIPTEPGIYDICVKIGEQDGGGAGVRKIWLRQNGSSAGEGSVEVHSQGNGLYVAKAFFNGSTDYGEILVSQTSGGPVDVRFDEFDPRLDISHFTLI